MAKEAATVYTPHPLEVASLELHTVRALVDLVYSSVCEGKGQLLESLSDDTLSGVMHDVLERVDRAKEAIDSVPRMSMDADPEVSHAH